MKSLDNSCIRHKLANIYNTDDSTICEQPDVQSMCSTPNHQDNQLRMVQFMSSTLKCLNNPYGSSKTHKSSKPRISILPLTRNKIKSNLRSRKKLFQKEKIDEMQTTNAFHVPRFSPSRATKASCSGKQKYVQFFSMMSFMHNKQHKKSFKLEVMIDELGPYFNTHKERDYCGDISQIVAVSEEMRNCIVNWQGQLKYDMIKHCEGELSKLFFNICYQIYLYKRNKFNLGLLAIIHRDIEYYSRRMGMLGLTTLCCMDMGRVFCDYFQFQKASQQYSKAIKLAVYVGDKYSEEVAIDRLGMCEYYKGDMVSANFYHKNIDRLSCYQKLKIKGYYSNQKQIQKILQEKTKERSVEDQIKEVFFRHNQQNIEFNFDNMVKDNEFTQKNYDVFRNNLKEMIKINPLRKKVPLIKRALIKIDRIGEKTDCCKDYRVPHPSRYYSKTSGRCQEEFLMSHKSFNRNNVPYESMKIDKHCKMIDQILNFFINDHKSNASTQIKEDRESCLSEEQNG